MQINEEFWTLYLPQSHTLADSSDGIVCTAVHSAMQDLAARDSMVRLALSALAFMSLARVKHDVVLERQATETYVRALKAVNAALQHPATVRTDATLLACRALGSYEMFRPDRNHRMGTQASDWKRHVAGSARLIELRDHTALNDPEAAELFNNVRMASWMVALLWRGRYGLDGQSSTIVPRRQRSRALLEHFLDIVEKLPPLLHRLDRLGAEDMQDPTEASLRKLYFTFVGVCEELRAWQRDALVKSLQDQGSVHVNDGITQTTLASVFETNDYCWKVLIIYYWSACLVVHTTVATAHDLLSSRCTTTPFSGVTRPGWLDPFSYATLISLHLPSLFCAEAGLWGAQNGALPLALCIHFVAATAGADSQDWNHLGDLIKRSRIGGSLKDFMRSLANEGAPRGQMGDPSVKEDAERLGYLWFWGWATNHAMASDGLSA